MRDGFIEVYILLQIVGTALFMYGFFPPRIVLQNNATLTVNNSIREGRKADRLILMIIDAFSFDFVANPNYADDMSFLHSSIDRGDLTLFRMNVQSPTVTLPRIKALVSGIVPNFMDVVFNIAQKEFTEDNWLLRANNAGYKLLFYGDDTWFSMFKKETFMDRSEGTSSFFVKDYTQVDTNVTRYLEREFSTNYSHSWDILLLHYLGLDHIGHSLGGKHPEIHVKLREMDSVIDGIWRNFSKSRKEHENIYFFLLGDHGMTIAGGHGGSSERESYVPLVVYSSNKANQLKQTHKPIVNIQQVDLVPTISMLLNLGIPEKSVGVLLDEYFSNDLNDTSKNIKINARQLWSLAQENKGLFSEEELDQLKACSDWNGSTLDNKKFVSKCRLILKSTQRKFLSSNDTLNYPFIIVGTLISLTATTALLFNALKDQSISKGLFILVQPFTLFSSSFIEEEHDLWYFLFASYLFISVIKDCWSQKTKSIDYSKVYDLLLVLFIHRLARYPYEINRRRWTLEDEFGVFNVDNQLFANEKPYLWLLIVTLVILTNYPFKSIRSKRLISLANVFVLFATTFIMAVKFAHVQSTLFVHLLIVLVFLISEWTTGFIVWQLLVLNPLNYPIALLCQLIGYKLGTLSRSTDFDHSMLLYAAFSATFFYTGGGNSLDTIDIATGYAGLTDFIPLIVGLQMNLNAYMGIVNLMIGWNFTSKSTQLPIKHILVDIFALRSLALFFTILNLFHQRGHLFNWSVFTPKLLLEIFHFLAICFWALAEYFIGLYTCLVSRHITNKIL